MRQAIDGDRVANFDDCARQPSHAREGEPCGDIPHTAWLSTGGAPWDVLVVSLGGLVVAALVTLVALGATPTATADPRDAGAARPPSRSYVETGLVLGAGDIAHPLPRRLGAKLARVDFQIGRSVASMRPVFASLARRGTRVLPVAGFAGRLPTVAQARSLRRWSDEFGAGGAFWRNRSDGRLAIRDIEFGNETSYKHQYGDGADSPSYQARARAYGRLANIALDALSGTPTGLMVQADDGGLGPTWVDNMLSAAPALGKRVSAWTVHPYGDMWMERLRRLVESTRAAGAPDDVPIAVTEWGLASANGRCLTDNYGWNRCMTYDKAAATARSAITGVSQYLGGRLRTFIVYAAQDLDFHGRTRQREDYFGVMTVDQREKGPYTRLLRGLFAGRLIG